MLTIKYVSYVQKNHDCVLLNAAADVVTHC